MNLSKVFLAATFSLSILFANTEGTLASSTQQDSLTQNTNIANTKPFKDVSKNSTHYTAIHAMRDMGIINGYADNTFKPNDPINRQNGAALLTRYTPVKYTGTAKFTTLSDVTTKNANYNVLVEFQKLGVFNVKADGKIYPTKAMTRGEIAKGVAIAFKLPIEKTTKSSFKDVKASSDYSPYIEALKKAGIATGYGDGTFKPDTTLSRAHFSAFMYRAIQKVGKTTEEKPNNDTGTTAPTTPVETTPTTPVETKPSTPTDNGSISIGDYAKPTEYTGNFKYTNDGKVKFEDKKLEDYPLYSYPDYKNDHMYFDGKTYSEHNAMNDKILVARKDAIKVIGNGTYPLNYTNGKLSTTTSRILLSALKPYGFDEGEVYRLITYLYYTGDVYQGKNITAYMSYTKDGLVPTLYVSFGDI